MREPIKDPYAWHRAALAGEKPQITSEPQCGWFLRRFIRFGPQVPCRIWLEQKVDPETGELTEDAVLCCDIDGRPADPEEQWSYLAGDPITEKEFEHQTAVSRYAKKRDPREPLANPRKPIDLLTIPVPTFKPKRRRRK